MIFCLSRFSRYNKKNVDPYWNTREASFLQHTWYLMTRFYLPVDIYWLPPQIQARDESSIDFANRVKTMISNEAGLHNLSWDGYLKNFLESRDQEKLQRISQESYANVLRSRLRSD
jgi:glycerol-3-phosphate O-acyltransferase 3/4